MIKAAGKTGLGEPLLFLGLSGENVTRLAAGESVRITAQVMAALGLPPGLKINTSSGAITGSIAVGDSANGPYRITVVAEDGAADLAVSAAVPRADGAAGAHDRGGFGDRGGEPADLAADH